jgi:hypothetical protein
VRSKLKALLATALAIGALGAVAVSDAQAAPGELHIDLGPKASLLGQWVSEHVLRIGTAELKCSGGFLEATIENAQSDKTQLTTKEFTATPEYTWCKINGEIAQLKLHGCKYTFRGTAALTAQVQIVGCTAGKAIEILWTGCTITINEQKELGHIVFTNENPGAGEGEPMETETKDLIANMTLTGIAYARDGVLCPQGAAELSGTTTIRAFEDLGFGGEDSIYGHEYKTLKYGEQVGLFAT